jgi:lipase chaperone LimK
MTQNNSEVDTILRGAELRLRRLSLERLRVADDFLAYLEEKEADASTRELLSLAGFEDHYREALRQSESGETVRFEDIRRDV